MSYILLVILFTRSLISMENVEVIDLKVDYRDVFPYPTNKSFSINVVPTSGVGPITSAITNTMVILLKEDNGVVLVRAIFDYGFKEMIDLVFKSEYMTIPIWAKDEKSRAMNISILFWRQANHKWLELHQLPAKTTSERRQMLENMLNTQILFRERLDLLVPPRIQLSVLSPDERMNELMPRELGKAICRASDGIPVSKPMFVGLDNLIIKDESFDESKNEQTVMFLVSIADHEKRLRCVAAGVEATSLMFVMHHPSKVTVSPEPGRVLENGSVIECLRADGYPMPTVQWTVLDAPINASRYYSIVDEGTKFMLGKDAPQRSKWTLNCSSTNIIRKSVGMFNRTVTFTVGRPTEGLVAELNLTTQIMIGIVVVAAIVLFSVMIVVIVCIIRRCCLNQESSVAGSRRKNGVLVKAVSKEGMDMEHAAPLLPDCPPNYFDLSNARPVVLEQSPPNCPLSSYNIDIDGPVVESQEKCCEVSGVIGSEECVNGEEEDSKGQGHDVLGCSEVTYAELSVSNLPMKSDWSSSPDTQTPSAPMAELCDEDQVIYSQIVGTVSPSDSANSQQQSFIEPSIV